MILLMVLIEQNMEKIIYTMKMGYRVVLKPTIKIERALINASFLCKTTIPL